MAPTTWEGSVPAGTTLFRVASPYMWILMRILVGQAPGDVAEVGALQRAVEITPLGEIGGGGVGCGIGHDPNVRPLTAH